MQEAWPCSLRLPRKSESREIVVFVILANLAGDPHTFLTGEERTTEVAAAESATRLGTLQEIVLTERR